LEFFNTLLYISAKQNVRGIALTRLRNELYPNSSEIFIKIWLEFVGKILLERNYGIQLIITTENFAFLVIDWQFSRHQTQKVKTAT
jgi:hypothetical protein